jgi:hypothetical protein
MPFHRVPRLGRLALVAGGVALLSAQALLVAQWARVSAAETASFTTLQAASQWLEQNTAPGERVYHSDWDDFPALFFHNTHNTYIVGLDPTYMYLEQPELYLLWRSIGRGEVSLPSAAIRDRLGARWGITPRSQTRFVVQAANDPDMEIVFETPSAIVYRIKG